MASTLCPSCGRKLSPAAPNAPMTCDGCGHAFDPARVRWQKASLPKRLLGWFLIVVAVMSALRSLPEALALPYDRDETVPYVIGLYLVPFLLLIAGRALSRSRLVEDPAPAAQTASSPSQA